MRGYTGVVVFKYINLYICICMYVCMHTLVHLHLNIHKYFPGINSFLISNVFKM